VTGLAARRSFTTEIRNSKGPETIGAFFADMSFGGRQFHAHDARSSIYRDPGVKPFAG
jgi:hypothetical protein